MAQRSYLRNIRTCTYSVCESHIYKYIYARDRRDDSMSLIDMSDASREDQRRCSESELDAVFVLTSFGFPYQQTRSNNNVTVSCNFPLNNTILYNTLCLLSNECDSDRGRVCTIGRTILRRPRRLGAAVLRSLARRSARGHGFLYLRLIEDRKRWFLEAFQNLDFGAFEINDRAAVNNEIANASAYVRSLSIVRGVTNFEGCLYVTVISNYSC